MYNLYRVTTASEAMTRLFATRHGANLPAFGDIYPDRAAPVILAREDYATWLAGDYAQATALAKPYPSEAMRIVD